MHIFDEFISDVLNEAHLSTSEYEVIWNSEGVVFGIGQIIAAHLIPSGGSFDTCQMKIEYALIVDTMGADLWEGRAQKPGMESRDAALKLAQQHADKNGVAAWEITINSNESDSDLPRLSRALEKISAAWESVWWRWKSERTDILMLC